MTSAQALELTAQRAHELAQEDPDRLARLLENTHDQARAQLTRDLADHLDLPTAHVAHELDFLQRNAGRIHDDPNNLDPDTLPEGDLAPADTRPAASASPVSCYNGGNYNGEVDQESRSDYPPASGGVWSRSQRARADPETEPSHEPMLGNWQDVFRAEGKPYPEPHEARKVAPTEHRAKLMEGGWQRDARTLALEEGLGAGAIAQKLAVSVQDVVEALENTEGGLRYDREPDPKSPEPIELEDLEGETDTRVLMVGSQPPRKNGSGEIVCLTKHVLFCESCEERREDGKTIPSPDGDGLEPWPRSWRTTRKAQGCENPTCRTCKTIYVPTRAAAGALRVQAALEKYAQEGRDVVVRHVVVSPPDADPSTREDVKDLERRAWELVKRKGALGGVGVTHPWRGKPSNRFHEGRPSWHFHYIAVFPDDTPDERSLPIRLRGPWDKRFIPGGVDCCRCRYDPDNDRCCDGSCGYETCPHHRLSEARRPIEKLKRRRKSTIGRLGLACARDDADAEARHRDELGKLNWQINELERQHADELDALEAGTCDEGWLFKVVTEDGSKDSPPLDVLQGPYELQGGQHAGREVDQGVLALLMYELDHAGHMEWVDAEEDARRTRHTLRWYGDFAYNQLGLEDEDDELADALVNGTGGQGCPICEEGPMQPVVNMVDRAVAERTLEDPQKYAALRARQDVAREVLQREQRQAAGDDDRPPPDTGDPPDDDRADRPDRDPAPTEGTGSTAPIDAEARLDRADRPADQDAAGDVDELDDTQADRRLGPHHYTHEVDF